MRRHHDREAGAVAGLAGTAVGLLLTGILHTVWQRLLAPGYYGMEQPNWLGSIEVVSQPYTGYWEQRGWIEAAIVKSMSRIDGRRRERPDPRARRPAPHR